MDETQPVKSLSSPTSASVKERTPRLLALDDYGAFQTLSPSESVELINWIMRTPLERCDTEPGEIVARACRLIYLLVASGGACQAGHVRLIERLKIDAFGARLGFVRWSERVDDLQSGKRGEPILGPRQFLYAPGRVHLLAFTDFCMHRLKEFKARQGEPLLPAVSVEFVKRAAQDHTWMSRPRPAANWTAIYGAWLNQHLTLVRELTKASVSTSLPIHPLTDKPLEPKLAKKSGVTLSRAATEIALWSMLDGEPPLLLEMRRGRLLAAPLPDEQFASLLPQDLLSFGMSSIEATIGDLASKELRKQDEFTNNTASLDSNNTPPAEAEEIRADDGSDYDREAVEEDSSDKELNLHRAKRRRAVKAIKAWLTSIVNNKRLTLSEAARDGESLLQTRIVFADPTTRDLYLVVEWLVVKLKGDTDSGKLNRKSTVNSYGNRLLDLLAGLRLKSFFELDTTDIAAFLRSNATSSAAKRFRGSASSFHHFLVRQGLAPADQFQWRSRSLFFSEGYRESALITEDEFQAVLRTAAKFIDRFGAWTQVVLILMRRAGLRCIEVAGLTPRDFHGLTEVRLFVRASKTEAGKRALPLYLLCDEEELKLVLDFVETVERDRGAKAPLIAGPDNEPIDPDVLGRRVVSLLKAGGVSVLTAHDLRHGFASALFVVWWLKHSARFRQSTLRTSDEEWAWVALHKFGRSEIEGRAVEYADDIRRLLGHAGLEVTLERYIHIVDIIVADAVRLAEHTAGKFRVETAYAASLVGVSGTALRAAIPNVERGAALPQRQASTVTLQQVEQYIVKRLTQSS